MAISTNFQKNDPETWTADVLIIPAFEQDNIQTLCPELPWLNAVSGIADFRGKKDEKLLLHTGKSIARILLAGMGKRLKTQIEQLDALRIACGSSSVWCREHGIAGIFAMPAGAILHAAECEPALALREAVCGTLLGLYRNTNSKFKSENPDNPPDPDPERIDLLCTSPTSEIEYAALAGAIHAEAVMLARNLGNMPANCCTPADMEDYACSIAGKNHLDAMTLHYQELKEFGMNAMLAVGAGAAGNPKLPQERHTPRLIILEYAPAGQENADPFIVVGKGITFDSGGISLKPAANMQEMKSDMGGAAAVLGLFSVLPKLQIKRHVVGMLACAENLPGAWATRPGDVVKSFSGKTIEIVNTDAEGRLVLCDALSYAQKRWKPSMLVDVATLTGACVVALGNDVAGLFCKNLQISERIRNAGAVSGEPFWSLPLHDRYFENLKSEIADFANAGTREGGSCSAAIFLKQFIHPENETIWAHLDIAGPAFHSRKTATNPAGASGFAVRTLIALAQN